METIEDAAKEYAFEVVPPDYCYDNMTDEIRELVKEAYKAGAWYIQNIRIAELTIENAKLRNNPTSIKV